MSQGIEVLRRSVREFAETEVKPLAKIIDEENIIPEDLLKRAGGMGFFALRVPEEYGGPGLSLTESVVVVEELSRASSALGVISAVSGSTAVYPILTYGSGELKEKYLGILARGGVAAFALTEPCCGTDAAAITTRAVKDGDEYVVTGEKIFITGASYADFFLTAVRTGRPEDRHRGISLLIIDKGPCVEVSKLEMMGYRGSGTSAVRFDECRVPAENLVGEENRGFKYLMMALNEGRIVASATGLGIMEAAFEEALRYSQERTSMGKPIIEHQMVQYMIAEMAMLLEATRLLIYEAARRFEEKDPEVPRYSSMAKLHTAKAGVELVRMAMQILGGIGYSKDSVVERLYRDAKMLEIGDGTNEAQRIVIVKSLLGRVRAA